jgi:hypothetical protein
MSDKTADPDFDASTVRWILASRGVYVDASQAAVALTAVRHARAVLASLVDELYVDDDISAFRAILAQEARL